MAIKLEDLKDGYVYEIKSRNAHYGIWYNGIKAFLISREKFGDIYLFYEFYKDMENKYGTAFPINEIEKVPFESLPTYKDIFEVKRVDIISYLREKEKAYYLEVYNHVLRK